MFKRSLRAIGIIGILVCILYSTFLFARAPDTFWITAYGGSDGEGVTPCSRRLTMVVFLSGTPPHLALLMTKILNLILTDMNGDASCTRIYSQLFYEESGRYVQQMTDGGYIIAGSTAFSSGDIVVYSIKTGGLAYSLVYGSVKHNLDFAGLAADFLVTV